MYLSIYLPIYLSICKLENEAILRDFVKFWFCSTFTTSKTQRVCETSFKNGKLSAELTASCQCGLRFFHSICLKCCACHEKLCQVIRRAAPVTQNHLSKPEDLMLQNATPLRKSAPWPPNISNILWWTCLLYCACHAKCIFAAFGTATKPSRFAHFWQGAQSLAPATQNDIWKWSVSVSFLQRCALFQHLNVQKCSEPVNFLHFWLRHVLRATTVCTFSASQLPKVVRTWGVLHILTSKRASPHNGVQFFISHLAPWLCTCRFSEPTFRPSWATNHWKNTVFRDFSTFSRTCIFILFLFSSLTHPTSAAFSSVHMSEVWLLDFLDRIPIMHMFVFRHIVVDRSSKHEAPQSIWSIIRLRSQKPTPDVLLHWERNDLLWGQQ